MIIVGSGEYMQMQWSDSLKQSGSSRMNMMHVVEYLSVNFQMLTNNFDGGRNKRTRVKKLRVF